MKAPKTYPVVVSRQGTKVGEHTIKVLRTARIELEIDGVRFSETEEHITWLGYRFRVVVKSHANVELLLPIKLAQQLNLLQTATAIA